MIFVPFELEEVEFRILIPGIPLLEKSQKECGLAFAFLLFLSSFILFESVGTKEMTVLISTFLTFLTIGQRKRHYKVCKSSIMHS